MKTLRWSIIVLCLVFVSQSEASLHSLMLYELSGHSILVQIKMTGGSYSAHRDGFRSEYATEPGSLVITWLFPSEDYGRMYRVRASYSFYVTLADSVQTFLCPPPADGDGVPAGLRPRSFMVSLCDSSCSHDTRTIDLNTNELDIHQHFN